VNLYLVRHAIAVPRDASNVLSDEERELTPEGIAKMEKHIAALLKLGVEFDHVLTSPLVRARQTAELIQPKLAPGIEIRTDAALAPGSDPHALLDRLGSLPSLEDIALVGHEPDLGDLATLLIAGKQRSGIRFKKGGVACIELDDFVPPIRGTLRWLLTPKQMAKIA
jgi:phosphohistidine phosphatase